MLVIAGPNGAGKTPITSRLRRHHWSQGAEYLNPDDVARDRYGDWNSPSASLEAARGTTARREELLSDRMPRAFETVLSSQVKVEFLSRARDTGYFIRLFFVSTGGPRINATRVADRVLRGDPTVPIEKIISRYERSLALLPVGLALAHRGYLFDNSANDQDATLCVRTVDGELRKVYAPMPDWISAVTAPTRHHNAYEELRAAS